MPICGRTSFDYIVIESASPSWEHDRKVILEIKRLQPDTRIVVTGPITSMGNALLDAAPVHACVRGEYEKGVTRVIEGADGVIDFDLLTLRGDEQRAIPLLRRGHCAPLFRLQSEGPAGAACAGLEQPRLPLQMHLLRLAGDHDRKRSRRLRKTLGSPLHRRLHGGFPDRVGAEVPLSIDLFRRRHIQSRRQARRADVRRHAQGRRARGRRCAAPILRAWSCGAR